jgi:RHS repeat-associated protein
VRGSASRRGPRPGQPRTVAQTFNPARATLDSLVVEPEGNADVKSTTTYTFDERGMLTETKVSGSGTSRVETTIYDSVEGMYPEQVFDGLRQKTINFYLRGHDSLAWSRDPNGKVTRWKYDGFGRLRTVDGPSQADSDILYTAEAGRPLVVETRAAGGAATRLGYDRLGREVMRARKNLNGTWSEVRQEYDRLGQIARVVRPYGETRFSYDIFGRVISERRPDEGSQDPLGVAIRTEYRDHYETRTFDQRHVQRPRESYVKTDGLGQVVETGEKVEGRFVVTNYEYRPLGLLESVTHGPSGSRSTTSMEYDLLGRRTKLTTPDTGTTTTKYNALGEVREEQDQTGRLTKFERDVAGRVQQKIDADGVTQFLHDSAPNGLGALAAARAANGVVTVLAYEPTFGALRRTDLYVPDASAPTSMGAPGPFSIEQTMDEFGRTSTVTYPATGASAPFATKYEYAGNGVLSRVQNPEGTTNYWRLTEEDPFGRVKVETFGNEVTSTRQYSPLTGRLQSITTVKPSEVQTFQNLRYEYNPDGTMRLRSDARQALHEGFVHDELGRLESWYEANGQGEAINDGWRVNFKYDDRGNLTDRIVESGGQVTQSIKHRFEGTPQAGPHRVTRSDLWPGATFGYDGVGNVQNHPGVGTIDYTAFNLPRKITKQSQVTTYAYDAFGGRVSKTWTGGSSPDVVYMGGLYERRKDGNDFVHVHYIPAAGRVVAQVTRSNQSSEDDVTYLYADHLGSTEVVHKSNNTMDVRRQDPFGHPVAIVNGRIVPTVSATPPGAASASAVTRGFTGHEEEPELGLVNMQGRIYDPRLGRFLQADPFVQAVYFSQSYNRYSYAWNNPLRRVDPTGFESESRELTDRELFALQCQRFSSCSDYGDPDGFAELGLEKLIQMAQRDNIEDDAGLIFANLQELRAEMAAGFRAEREAIEQTRLDQGGSTAEVLDPSRGGPEALGEVYGDLEASPRGRGRGLRMWEPPNLRPARPAPLPRPHNAPMRGPVVYPRGEGAASGPVPRGYTSVSRWVDAQEAQLWMKGQGTFIPPGVGRDTGRVFVTAPDMPRPGMAGPIRIDFSVPQSALQPGGIQGWYWLPQSIQNTPIYNVSIHHP